MGDEFDVSGCFVSADGELFPLGSLSDVGIETDDVIDPFEPFECLSATFTVTAEAFSDLAGEIDMASKRVRSFVVELDRLILKSFPGPSRFMRSRRMWQCRRGRRNANAERRKLSRKRRHAAYCKQRLVFPNTIITDDAETNELRFEVYGGTCLQGPTP